MLNCREVFVTVGVTRTTRGNDCGGWKVGIVDGWVVGVELGCDEGLVEDLEVGCVVG